jgi:structural maintenance of chromosome 4
VAQLTREIADNDAQIQALEKEEPVRATAYKAAREKADEARATTQTAASRSTVLKELLKQRASGRIRGIHGRLGDLGVIDARYDVAVTTACAQLEHIVVDTAETGQKCIAFLRAGGLGRATFLLLDQLGPVRDKAAAGTTPEGVPRLFDLVTPKDPIYAPAFYAALRETLVARDLAQANRVAFGGPKRARVVTEDGNLIETTGLMSGGGAKPQRGGMGTAMLRGGAGPDDEVTPQALAALDKERDACEAAWRAVQTRLQAAMAQRTPLAAALAKATTEASKAVMDVRAAEAELESLQEQTKQAKYVDVCENATEGRG